MDPSGPWSVVRGPKSDCLYIVFLDLVAYITSRKNYYIINKKGMIEIIREIALKAGDIIMNYYESDFDISTKTDHSPVTSADLDADKFIVKELTASYPDIPIISEESGIPDYEERKGWSQFWLVDPLDGTKEFIHKNGEFTVNIALIKEKIPVMGVVYAPAIKTMYFAKKDIGSWKVLENSQPVRIFSEKADKNESLRVVESRSHKSRELEEYLSQFNITERISAGSSLKFCVVAEGKADIYPRLGPTMEWDVAAGDCVYRYSASQGVHESGLTYNKPDLRNSHFIIGF